MNTILKNKIILIFSFILVSLNFFGDNKNDSLLKIINSNVNDSIVSDCYFQLAKFEKINSPKQALIYINKSIYYNNKFSNKFQYEHFLEKGNVFRLLGEMDSSLYYNNLVYAQALKSKHNEYIGVCFESYGLISIAQGNFQKAIEQFTKELVLKKKYKLKMSLSGIFNNIGNAYGSKGDWLMAKEYFEKALKEELLDKREMSLGNIYNNLGIVFILNQQLDSAKKYLTKGLDYRYKIHDNLGITGSLNNLALLELEANNFKNALTLADSAFNIAKTNGYKKIELEVYDSYDQIYSKMGNYKMAYEYLNKKNKLKFAFEKEEFKNSIQQLESNIQLEQKQSLLLEKDLALTKSENQKQRQFGFIILAVILIIALGLFLFSFFKNNKKLSTQNLIISEQKYLIEEKHKDITDSITYAHRIQSSLIPSQKEVNKQYQNLSILFMPRDIVSGDFYWCSKIKDINIFVLSDCTGHGVPGAFMSIIGINQLNTIVNEKGFTQPGLILDELKVGVINSINSNDAEEVDKKDGMDVALICFNKDELSFSGANQSVLILRNAELIELKGNKQPIGLSEKNESFATITCPLFKTDRIILYTDGIVDQFGGADGKKLKSRNFKNWILETAHLSLQDQKETIKSKLLNFKLNYEQTDDISFVIIEI